MRVAHYIKNLLIFAGIVCSGRLFVMEKFFSVVCGFFAFCCLSSVVYIINDLKDKEKDQNHPIKCKRPIAAGMITEKNAMKLLVFLLIVSAICHSTASKDMRTLGLWLLYFLLNLGYSLGLKQMPIVDVVILVAGFVIRVVYGAVIAEIEISNWLYLTVMTMACYLSFGKRRNELLLYGVGGGKREVLQFYTKGFLDKIMYMFLTLTNVFYALWSMSEETIKQYQGRLVIGTIPIVLIICMKYSLDIEQDGDGDPVEVLMQDKILIVLCLLYAMCMFLLLYV